MQEASNTQQLQRKAGSVELSCLLRLRGHKFGFPDTVACWHTFSIAPTRQSGLPKQTQHALSGGVKHKYTQTLSPPNDAGGRWLLLQQTQRGLVERTVEDQDCTGICNRLSRQGRIVPRAKLTAQVAKTTASTCGSLL
jgi:hypothetical protein